jgi:hypothetical protein
MPPFEAQPLNGAAGGYDDLLERIGDAGVVRLRPFAPAAEREVFA